METILIIANSGRMLAQAAKNVGLKPLVIDLFADMDTQTYATQLLQVNSLAEPDLAPAVDYFVGRYGVTHAVYGSGFENYPESLNYLNSRLIIVGNQPDIFARQLDKPAFFSTLDALAIPHPDVVFTAPAPDGDWLMKPMRGQGGLGIKPYRADDGTNASVYWQRFLAGTPYSVLFLANSQQAEVIGFNSQWPVAIDESQAFVFSGVVNCCGLPEKHKRLVTGWLQQLVPVFGLTGLNSLDFIHLDNCSYVLEINPRPSASMQLYDKDLLRKHLATTSAPREKLRRLQLPRKMGCTGYQIVYAPHDVMVPNQFEWPNWCMDLPKSGDFCRAGQPLCSIIAHRIDLRSVVETLLAKQQLIISKLERF